MLRINRLFRVKRHSAELLWKYKGWAIKTPNDVWDVAIAYQQGLPTYLVADKISAKKKIAWINANIFGVGYNANFNIKFYKKYEWVVAVSQILYDILIERIPELKVKTFVIYDIINPQIIKEYSKDSSKSFKINPEEFVLVTTGRLVPPKGYDIAILAAKELKEAGLKFHWYFIGEGPERSNIETIKSELGVDDEIVLLGLQTNPYPFMAQADIYVQTSKYEGFGLTIGEAKILGKPIVSTNFDVVYNQLTHEKNGLIADMSGHSVAENILRLIQDTGLRNSLIDAVNKETNTTYLSEVVKVEQLID